MTVTYDTNMPLDQPVLLYRQVGEDDFEEATTLVSDVVNESES